MIESGTEGERGDTEKPRDVNVREKKLAGKAGSPTGGGGGG